MKGMGDENAREGLGKGTVVNVGGTGIRLVADNAAAARVKSICRTCTGSGYIMIKGGEDYNDCPTCYGSGRV